MNLFDMLQQGQNGNVFSEIARRFGLSEDQVKSAVEAMTPAFSTGLRRNTAAPESMANFLRALSGGSHAGYFDDAGRALSDDGIDDGKAILGHLFGSKDVSRAVAAQAEAATGIGQDILKQMLPALAAMVMGGLSKQAQDLSKSPFGAFLEQFSGGFPTERSAGEGPLDRYERGRAGDSPLGNMFEQFTGGTDPDQFGRRMFGDMFDSGRRMGEEYQKNMESIFDRYLEGIHRR